MILAEHGNLSIFGFKGFDLESEDSEEDDDWSIE